MNNLRQFSVLDSRFQKFEDHRGMMLQKETRLNNQLKPYHREIQRLIGQYIEFLKGISIPLPAVISSESDGERLLYLCEYKGPNVLEFLGSGGTKALLKDTALLDQILSIIGRVQKGKISFDPHIKNFVIDNGSVYYVDFTPPWLPEYYDIRLSVATLEEKEILLPFYRCMEPENLGYHFCSDFVKMNEANRAFLPQLYAVLQRKGLVSGGYDAFLTHCEQIKNDELQREKQGIYLL